MAKIHPIEPPLSSYWAFLLEGYAKIAGLAGVILAPIKLMLLNIYLLVAIDAATGIWRSYKEGGWASLLSSKGRRTVTKGLAYFLAVYVTSRLEHDFLPQYAVTKAIATYIALIEVKSIFENLHDITGIDLWYAMTSKLKLAVPRKPRRRRKKKD